MDQLLQQKPRQNFAGLWNISFGFFGIQIGFALQNANMSRVFQSPCFVPSVGLCSLSGSA